MEVEKFPDVSSIGKRQSSQGVRLCLHYTYIEPASSRPLSTRVNILTPKNTLTLINEETFFSDFLFQRKTYMNTFNYN